MVSGQTGRKPITGISSMATRQVLAELAGELRAFVGAAAW